MKRFLILLLCAAMLTGLCPVRALAAPEWPDEISIQAESGIVMDAASGTVLWEKDSHTPYAPASITKIMTALLVIENCDLDETVTFSYNAVHNVEDDSSSAGLDVGDELSVRDCLYALLLKSANEVANALAEHVSGTTEEFANLMNAKAAKLGCANTHFSNPSGLNDPEHYTSAYDMALITRAAISNPILKEIDSTLYYVLPPTKHNKSGLEISPKHRMLKRYSEYYYPGVICGKTGYTSKAGNTLVTCAERDEMTLVAVILKGSTPEYWTDTKSLLDLGFDNFYSLKVSDYDTTYSAVMGDMTIAGLSLNNLNALTLEQESTVILPKEAKFEDVTSSVSYDLTPTAPSNAAARIDYTYNGRSVGSSYLCVDENIFPPASETAAETSAPESSAAQTSKTAVEPPASRQTGQAASTGVEAASSQPAAEVSVVVPIMPAKKEPLRVPSIVWTILLAVILLSAIIGAAAGIHLYSGRRKPRLSFSSGPRKPRRRSSSRYGRGGKRNGFR